MIKGNPQWPQSFYPTTTEFIMESGDWIMARCSYSSLGKSTHTYTGWWLAIDFEMLYNIWDNFKKYFHLSYLYFETFKRVLWIWRNVQRVPNVLYGSQPKWGRNSSTLRPCGMQQNLSSWLCGATPTQPCSRSLCYSRQKTSTRYWKQNKCSYSGGDQPTQERSSRNCISKNWSKQTATFAWFAESGIKPLFRFKLNFRSLRCLVYIMYYNFCSLFLTIIL